jgi:cytochrome P450
MPLAQLELQIVTTSFFRNFDFVVHDSRSHKPRQMFTLVPDQPVKVSCSKKSNS